MTATAWPRPGSRNGMPKLRLRAIARLAPPSRPRSLGLVALIALAGLHALVFWRWYDNRYPLPAADTSVLEVRLIGESAPRPPMLPQPAPPHRTPMTATVLPATPTPIPVQTGAPAVTISSPLHFERDGTMRLPAEARFTTPLDTGIARGRELLARGHNLIHCRRSRFDNSPTPAETAAAAARGAHMAHLVMGNPLDPLNDVGQQQADDAAGEHAVEKRRIEEQACDY